MSRQRFRVLALAMVVVLTSQNGAAKQNAGTPLAREYDKWLDKDVHWIISPQEKQEFLKLRTDEQRDHFVVEFWRRRNPDPGNTENTFKEEHYRRIAFSNVHFAASVPGWKTDRGHVYIVYGPPDSIVKHPSAGAIPTEELWNYRRIRRSSDVTLKFVDRCACGQFELVSNLPSD